MSVVHVGGDEVHVSTLSCEGDVEQLKQKLIGRLARQAAGLGLSVQAWDDALAAKHNVLRLLFGRPYTCSNGREAYVFALEKITAQFQRAPLTSFGGRYCTF